MLALAAGFVYLVASVAFTGAARKPTDANLKAGVITLPSTAIPATDGAVAPLIITEANRPANAQGATAGNRGVFEPNWVEDVGAAGIVILVVGMGLSTIALWMQTRRLATSAQRQYREAERAFLNIDAGEPEDGNSRDGTPIVRVPIRCTNNGRTPTRYGLGHVNWHHFDEGGPEVYSFNDFWSPQQPKASGIAIGPKGAIGMDLIEIPKAEILKTPGAVFCWGWVDYNDMFEESPRHRTEFCFEILSVERGGRSEFRYRYHRLHNGYDDECYRPPALYTRSIT